MSVWDMYRYILTRAHYCRSADLDILHILRGLLRCSYLDRMGNAKASNSRIEQQVQQPALFSCLYTK